jgi:hypothetical protein
MDASLRKLKVIDPTSAIPQYITNHSWQGHTINSYCYKIVLDYSDSHWFLYSVHMRSELFLDSALLGMLHRNRQGKIYTSVHISPFMYESAIKLFRLYDNDVITDTTYEDVASILSFSNYLMIKEDKIALKLQKLNFDIPNNPALILYNCLIFKFDFVLLWYAYIFRLPSCVIHFMYSSGRHYTDIKKWVRCCKRMSRMDFYSKFVRRQCEICSTIPFCRRLDYSCDEKDFVNFEDFLYMAFNINYASFMELDEQFVLASLTPLYTTRLQTVNVLLKRWNLPLHRLK